MIEYIYIALIALPLVLVAFNTAYWGGVYKCLCISEIILAAMAFMLFQAGMFFLGSWTGGTFALSMGWLSIPIAEAVILLTSVKLIYSSFRIKVEQKNYNLAKYGELIAVSFASSLNAFMLGLGFGLLREPTEKTFAIIAIATAIFTIAGAYMGKRYGRIIIVKVTGILAGIAVVVLGLVLALNLYNVI